MCRIAQGCAATLGSVARCPPLPQRGCATGGTQRDGTPLGYRMPARPRPRVADGTDMRNFKADSRELLLQQPSTGNAKGGLGRSGLAPTSANGNAVAVETTSCWSHNSRRSQNIANSRRSVTLHNASRSRNRRRSRRSRPTWAGFRIVSAWPSFSCPLSDRQRPRRNNLCNFQM